MRPSPFLLQMMVRASNAVGYTSYPDNVVQHFIAQAARAGIDLFRVFDSLNGVDNMRVAIDAVRESGALCEAAMCYTGDLFDAARPKWGLRYYVDLARQLEKAGTQILGIKDMAGVCRPPAARALVEALRGEVGLPIHFDTHDTYGLREGDEIEVETAPGEGHVIGLVAQAAPDPDGRVTLFFTLDGQLEVIGIAPPRRPRLRRVSRPRTATRPTSPPRWPARSSRSR
jgi:pyruvate carboxylase